MAQFASYLCPTEGALGAEGWLWECIWCRLLPSVQSSPRTLIYGWASFSTDVYTRRCFK